MQTIDDVSCFTKLLEDFKQIGNYIKTDPTFLEISGYPHYENVCSNILSFYLDPGKEHGLKDLALFALLECTKQTANISNVSVEREVFTGNGRIDLVIYSDECIIAIENKIFHGIINDFDDYGQYINNHANGRDVILLILGLGKDDGCKYSGFISISYNDYFEAIKANIGRYLANSNNKYLIFLLEFMRSIEHLIEGSAMNKDIMQFFKKNLQDTTTFMNTCIDMKAEMRNKVNQLDALVNINAPKEISNKWIYRDPRQLYDVLVHDINAGFHIAVDCTISPGGWEITLFDRNTGSMDKLKDLLNEIGVTYSMDHDRCRADVNIAYDAQIEMVAEKLTDLLLKIIEIVSRAQPIFSS